MKSKKLLTVLAASFFLALPVSAAEKGKSPKLTKEEIRALVTKLVDKKCRKILDGIEKERQDLKNDPPMLAAALLKGYGMATMDDPDCEIDFQTGKKFRP